MGKKYDQMAQFIGCILYERGNRVGKIHSINCYGFWGKLSSGNSFSMHRNYAFECCTVDKKPVGIE